MAERFLYPDICVRSQVSERPYLADSDLAIRRFGQDLSETVTRVCGRIFKVTRDARPLENISPVNFSPEKGVPGLPQTPDDRSRLRRARGDLAASARLSFFRAGNRMSTQTSALMSPTPSLRGSAKSHGPERPRDGQNRCPNVDDPSGRNAPGNTWEKMVPAGLPGSNDSFPAPADPANDPTVGFLTESSEDDSSSSGRRTAKIRKTRISTETHSKYFAAVEGDKERDGNLVICGRSWREE